MRNARSESTDAVLDLQENKNSTKLDTGDAERQDVLGHQRLLGRTRRESNSLPGAAPGIDTKRARYDALTERFHGTADVTAVDYNAEGTHIQRALDRESMRAFIR
jgi:hypothetical protein